MKRVFIISVMLITAVSFATGQTGNKSAVQNSSAEQEIIKLERERLDAYARADREAFDRIVADDFTMTHGDGSIFDKAKERDVLRPSTASKPLPALIIEDVRVRIYGDTAVITGRLVEGERVGRVSLRFTNTVCQAAETMADCCRPKVCRLDASGETILRGQFSGFL